MSDKLIAGDDPYLYKGINVLRNRLEIHESHRLLQAELELTPLRAAMIELGPPNMGLPHLCAIHYALFQDIYDWAGKLREIDIAKDDTPFCHFAYIEREGNSLMQALENEDYLVGLTQDALCERIAHYYSEINLLHPFRYGSGRAQRIFFEQLLTHAGYGIDWSQVDTQRWTDANKAAAFGDELPLSQVFKTIVSDA
ncbi:putative adenosine monophosphate-protein transferase Fic [Rouxiella sp. S1S-2]|uniref:putative adenosine monophosphate-protein transferase Fic n=1 Tax=Rouxiella sp. S1S-2 TaxID=2653856 RepID=UPI001264A837|nr:putative adenosine monophosphate-protein transferase Fic [Rouxiella sp. S1S-2]KAB7894966.1 putative adenosine monophosphate-protein transferase Fic [Rouxiella sp. S1S-2]